MWAPSHECYPVAKNDGVLRKLLFVEVVFNKG